MSNVLKMLSRGGAAAAETDPNFNQTVLLLHGDGTNGAQNNTFLDSSSNNFTITRNPATGPNAPTQGTFSPFSVGAGEWSNYFDGSGDRLNSSGSVNSAAGTSDFCVEFFVYYARYPAQFTTIFSTKPSNTGTATGYGIGVENDGTIYNYSNAYITESASGVFSLNTWHHMVFTRSGTTARLFLNGVLRATGTNSQDFSNQAFAIGSHVGPTGTLEPMAGYVSNVRFIKGSIPTTYQTSSTTVGDTIFTVPTTPLSTSSQGATSADVEILTCQSNRFVDNSTNAFIITGAGDVRVTPFSPFAPTAAYSAGTNGGSGYFDGSGDYLSITDNAAFEFGSGEFCVEFFGYSTAFGSSGTSFLGQWNSPNRGWIFGYINSGTVFTFDYSTNGSNGTAVSASTTVPLNQWNHYVACRSGNTLSIYLNGARIATASVSGVTIFAPTQALEIGRNAEATTLWNMNGYLSSLRIVKGSSPYDATQTTLTIPTSPLTAIANTSVLLNFTNAGIIDNTGKNNLETVGNAQIDTTTKKYGTGSMKFDGTGDYLLRPNSIDFNFGGGDFTIEFWMYASAQALAPICHQTSLASNLGWVLWNYDNANVNTVTRKLTFMANGASFTLATTSDAYTDNTWTHIAVVKSGTGSNNIKIYSNGTAIGTGTYATALANATQPFYVGGIINGVSWNDTRYFNGYIDDLRITKGVARYPTEPFPTKEFPDL